MEGKVAEVFVKVGDSVKKGDVLFSVETDKMTSDIPAPTTGTIAEVLIEPGQEITVGDEIFVINE